MGEFDWDAFESEFDDVEVPASLEPHRGLPWAMDLWEVMDSEEFETEEGSQFGAADQAEWEHRFGAFVDRVNAMRLRVEVLDEGSGRGSGESNGEDDLADDAVVRITIPSQALKAFTNAASEGRSAMQAKSVMMLTMLEMGMVPASEQDDVRSVMVRLKESLDTVESVCQAIATVGTGRAARIG